MPVVDAGRMSLSKLTMRCASSTTPLLIRGLTAKPRWRAAVAALANRTAFLQAFGKESVRLSLAGHLGQGPELSTAELDKQKLEAMAGWTNDGSTFRAHLLRQVAAGEARPWTTLGDFAGAMRDGTVPLDAYIFHNMTESRALAQILSPLNALWRGIILAQLSPSQKLLYEAANTAAEPAAQGGDGGGGAKGSSLTRIGLGAEATGTPFHDHEMALNLAFGGRKRWLVAKPATDLVLVSPADLLYKVLPSPSFRAAWRKFERGSRAWECTQHAGEVVFVPELFLHAIVNLEESLAVAIQCENNDPRKDLGTLNSLIVHASPGAASAPGPCGQPWFSPWEGLAPERSTEALRTLLSQV